MDTMGVRYDNNRCNRYLFSDIYEPSRSKYKMIVRWSNHGILVGKKVHGSSSAKNIQKKKKSSHKKSQIRKFIMNCRSLERNDSMNRLTMHRNSMPGIVENTENNPRTELLSEMLTAKEVLQMKNQNPKQAVQVAMEVKASFEKEQSETANEAMKKDIQIRERKYSAAIKAENFGKNAKRQPNALKNAQEMKAKMIALDEALNENIRDAQKKEETILNRQDKLISSIRDLGGVEVDSTHNKIAYRSSLPSLNEMPSIKQQQSRLNRKGYHKILRQLKELRLWGRKKQKMESNGLRFDRESSPSFITVNNVKPRSTSCRRSPVRTQVSSEALMEIEQFKEFLESRKPTQKSKKLM